MDGDGGGLLPRDTSGSGTDPKTGPTPVDAMADEEALQGSEAVAL